MDSHVIFFKYSSTLKKFVVHDFKVDDRTSVDILKEYNFPFKSEFQTVKHSKFREKNQKILDKWW